MIIQLSPETGDKRGQGKLPVLNQTPLEIDVFAINEVKSSSQQNRIHSNACVPLRHVSCQTEILIVLAGSFRLSRAASTGCRFFFSSLVACLRFRGLESCSPFRPE